MSDPKDYTGTLGEVAPNSVNPEVAVNDIVAKTEQALNELAVLISENGGLPDGGTEGQVLAIGPGATLVWIDPPQGGGTDLPAGGAPFRYLSQDDEGNLVWASVPAELPSNGEVGQFLARTANGVAWTNAPSGGGEVGEGLPEGGTAGQFLVRTADGYAWADAPSTGDKGATGDKGPTGDPGSGGGGGSIGGAVNGVLIGPWTPPHAADFPDLLTTAGPITMADDPVLGLVMEIAKVTGDRPSGIFKPLPASNWSVVCGINYHAIRQNYNELGILLWQKVQNRITLAGLDAATPAMGSITYWDGLGSQVGYRGDNFKAFVNDYAKFMKLEYNYAAQLLVMSISYDGQTFFGIGSVSGQVYDKIGLGFVVNSGPITTTDFLSMNVFRWEQAGF